MAEPAGFLARWSRLKRRARQSQPSNAASADVEAPAPAPEIIPEALPPIETLTAESDYKIFMRPGVPEVTRNAALQKLGAVREAILRKSFVCDGELHDQALWTILADEWQDARELSFSAGIH